MSWLSRLINVFRGDRVDRDLDDEREFHIQARTEELIRRGMAPEEAARQARRAFGNALATRESSRDAKMAGWLESLLRDARFGFRMLRKDRVVSLAALLSLSLAIGACTAAFSLIDALILRPLPVPEPDRLVYLMYPIPRSVIAEDGYMTNGQYAEFQKVAGGRIELFGYMNGGGLQQAAFGADSSEREAVRINVISGDAFRVLGLHPAIGRLLTAEDDTDHLVAVVSYPFWMRRFGGNPAAIGQSFTFRDKRYQIIGVAPKGFTGLEPGYLTDMWIPRTLDLAARDNFFSGWGQVWGRLAPGVPAEQARAVLAAAFTNFRRAHRQEFVRMGFPPDRFEAFIDTPLRLEPAGRGGNSLFRAQFRRPLWILAIVAALVLLIACSNVANLFTARAAAREREMALRISIGAGRWRLVRQVLIESGMLAAAACILGLAFAAAVAPAMVSLLAPPGFPAYLDLRLDARMLGFIALLCAVTTVLFGLAPAVQASSASPNEALKAGGGKHSGSAGMLRPVVAAQVGFSFAVVFLSGLLLLTFRNLTHVDLGLARRGVILFNLQARGLKPGDASRAAAQQLLDRLRSYPGVQAAGFSAFALVGGPFAPMMIRGIRFPGSGPASIQPLYLPVSPGFLDALQIHLIGGRDFQPRDLDADSQSVIVNEAFARAFLGGQYPVGQRFEQMNRDGYVPREIVGVVRDAKYNNLRDPSPPTVYEPYSGPGGVLEVRTAGDPVTLSSNLRQEIQRAGPSVQVTGVTLQSTQIGNTILSERLLALLAGFFAIVALVLAAVGLYGVLSYSVVRRTKEIGIRVALGAQPLRVVRLVVTDVGLMILLGVGAGMAGGAALARFVQSILFEVKPAEFASLALPLVCLLAASFAAALPPAMRAARVDPTVALRYE